MKKECFLNPPVRTRSKKLSNDPNSLNYEKKVVYRWTILTSNLLINFLYIFFFLILHSNICLTPAWFQHYNFYNNNSTRSGWGSVLAQTTAKYMNTLHKKVSQFFEYSEIRYARVTNTNYLRLVLLMCLLILCLT